MISRTMRRHLLRGLAAASVAALTTGTAVATVGAPRSEDRKPELPAIEVPAPADDADVDTAEPETDDLDAVAADDLDAASMGAEMRSDTATAVQEVITSTPPEERDAEFGAAVAEAASGGRAGGPEAEGATADDVDTSDDDDVDTSDEDTDDDLDTSDEDDLDTYDDEVDTSDEDDVDTSDDGDTADDMDTDVDPAEAADNRRDGDHRPN